MLSFLVALAFAPVLFGLVWIYMSFLRRPDRYTAVRVLTIIVLLVAILGGLLVQLDCLANSVTPNTRRFYVIALLAIEAIPLTFLVICRDPNRRRSKSANRTDEEGKKDSSG